MLIDGKQAAAQLRVAIAEEVQADWVKKEQWLLMSVLIELKMPLLVK